MEGEWKEGREGGRKVREGRKEEIEKGREEWSKGRGMMITEVRLLCLCDAAFVLKEAGGQALPVALLHQPQLHDPLPVHLEVIAIGRFGRVRRNAGGGIMEGGEGWVHHRLDRCPVD